MHFWSLSLSGCKDVSPGLLWPLWWSYGGDENIWRAIDQPDLYYQYNMHNYPNHTGEKRRDEGGVSWYITLRLLGSMVPFSMRVLHAELPMHCNNHQLSLNRFCLLQHTCQHVLDSLLAGSLPISNHKLTDQQKNGRYASGSGQGACPLVAKKV